MVLVLAPQAATGAHRPRPPLVAVPRISAPGTYLFRFGRSTGAARLRYTRFRCRLDRGRWRVCKTPFRIKLPVGTHRLSIRGITARGTVGQTRVVMVRVPRPTPRPPASDSGGSSAGGSGSSGGTSGSSGGTSTSSGRGGGGGGGGSRGGTFAPVTHGETFTVSVPARPASADIEIALDTTASMGPALAAAQSEARSIVTEVRQLIPDSRFAFVEFQDIAAQASPTPYKLLQPLTTDVSRFAAAVQSVRPPGSGVGGDNAEDYDFMFQQSLDASVGWRTGARKFLVVIGDAEPHGAGTDGLAGCRDGSPYAHGLTAPQVLSELAAAQHTLFMILQPGARATATLQCYQSIAALAGPGSAATSGIDTLPQTIASLVQSTFGSISTVAATVTAASPSPASASWVTITPASVGPVLAPVNTDFAVTVTVPAHTPHGTYTFTITATADGATIGTRTITVTV